MRSKFLLAMLALLVLSRWLYASGVVGGGGSSSVGSTNACTSCITGFANGLIQTGNILTSTFITNGTATGIKALDNATNYVIAVSNNTLILIPQ